jgi:hypothetical protein
MVSIIEKATGKVVVSSISPSELLNEQDGRLFILEHLPGNGNLGSLDEEAGKYEIRLNITNFGDP